MGRLMKFKEPLNTAVFTTKFVIEDLAPIVFVYHDSDGCWQFHGSEEKVIDDDIRIVSLDEIIALDQSIIELAEMPEGFEAVRSKKGDNWQIV